MQQPCLPVPRRRKRDESDQIPLSFDNIESMDAMEYMAAVVQQANAMPEIFVSDHQPTTPGNPNQKKKQHVPIEGSAASLQYLVSDRTSVLPPPSAQYVPRDCRAWVDLTLSNFSNLRDYLNQCQREGVGGKASDRVKVPPMKDRLGWHEFCVGRDEAQGNAGSYFGDNDGGDDGSGDDDGEAGNKEEEWRRNLPPNGYKPEVKLMLQLDQVMIRRVFSHLVYYVREGWCPSSSQRTKWVYALLARLGRPIHRDDAANMYCLLKELTQARTKLDLQASSGDQLARLNTLIVVVGIYFEQGGGYANLMEPTTK